MTTSPSELDLPGDELSIEKYTPATMAQATPLLLPGAALDLPTPPTPESVLSGPALLVPGLSVVPEVRRRKFTDTTTIRENIYDRVLQATRDMSPVSNQRHTLRLTDVDYQDPAFVSKKQQKQAVLNNLSQNRRLRGTWELVDNETQEIIDRKTSVIARVPYFTERGTFINNGVEYALKNQQRLLPGVYTRQQANGDVESHINPRTGTGPAHRFFMEPEKGVFKIKVGQGTVGLLPLLKIMGVNNSELQQAWGTDLYTTNQKSDSAGEYTKLRSKFLNANERQLPIAEQDERLRQKFAKMELDPFVTRNTLGVPYENMSAQAVLAVTQKLAAVSRGEAETDDRDSLAYQQFFGPEDLLAERITRDKDSIRRSALWRMSSKGSLKSMPTGLLTPQLQSALISSGLGLALEEINPTEIMDKLTSTTRLGEGGIASVEAIPAEARSVQPSMLGFIDPLRTPECYDRETEVLTHRGWVKWPDVIEDDEFACLTDKRLSFHKAFQLIRQRYKGRMYGVDTGRLAYLVTPNHRLWVAGSREEGTTCAEVSAEDCHGQKCYVDTRLLAAGTDSAAYRYLIDPTQNSCKSYVIDDFDDEVFCATVPGSLLYVRRRDTGGHWSGNSSKVGIDVYTASGAMKGDDGKLYSLFTDARTGESVYKNPQNITELTIGFPGALSSKEQYVPAMRRGKMEWVDKSELDLVVPNMEAALNPMSNLIPMKSQVKGQRLVMASRMLSQALPLVNAEAPLVQSAVPGTGELDSFESSYGGMLGAMRADKPGQVLAVTADEMQVRYEDGTTETHELYNQFPFNRKTFFHQTPLLQPGDTFAPGQLLAKSNYTDKTGAAALGLNARTAYMARDNFEDAITISRSFAERLKSEHMYQNQLDTSNGQTVADKNKYLQAFPGTFDKSQLANIDKNGMAKPGTEVKFGDPLVLGISPKVAAYNRVHKKSATGWTDSSVTWDHHDPGVVTDTTMTGTGPMVVVKSYSTMQVGDKLCYDPETRLLTRHRGWVYVAEITLDDELATMNPATEELEWQKPTHLHSSYHKGKMYKLVTKHLDMLVTPNHELWVAKAGEPYRAMTAAEFYSAKGVWRFKKDVKWVGQDVPTKSFVPCRGYKACVQVLTTVKMDDWLEFLGFYIAEGWTTDKGYVKIAQYRKSKHWAKLNAVIARLGLKRRYNEADGRFEFGNVWLADELRPLGNSLTKYVPEYVQDLCPRQLRIFLDAYLAGDGHFGSCVEYSTSSKRLAYDIQLICMKLGAAARVVEDVYERNSQWRKHRHWKARINTEHLRPTWKKWKASRYASNEEAMVPYDGTVHCVTVPNHILIVERRTKTYLSLNSGRYG